MKKRFIAGAVCPRCGEVDKIYVLEDETGRSKHCTRCDFSERQDDDQNRDGWSTIRLEDDR
ncbi:MAG: YheV family putative metal-binding protein [Pseudomonadales bacterium]|nr:YheV family putative metal-binding protein [Pseudomonadales bacterium]